LARHADVAEDRVEPRGPSRATDDHPGPRGIGGLCRRERTLGAVRVDRPRARPHLPDERVDGRWSCGQRQRRHDHHAERRAPAYREADHDAELAVARDELLGAVERIDEPTPLRALEARGYGALLGDD